MGDIGGKTLFLVSLLGLSVTHMVFARRDNAEIHDGNMHVASNY